MSESIDTHRAGSNESDSTDGPAGPVDGPSPAARTAIGTIRAIFDPADHYWTVGADDERLWSSGVGGYVDASDGEFIAWSENGRAPSRIASEYELDQVLRQYGLSLGRTFAADDVLAALTLIDAARVKAALGRDEIGSLKTGDAEKLAALSADLRPGSAGELDPLPIEGVEPRKAIAEALADLTARFEAREAELIAKGILTLS